MNVAPESDYGKALEVIAKWQKDFKQVYEALSRLLENMAELWKSLWVNLRK